MALWFFNKVVWIVLAAMLEGKLLPSNMAGLAAKTTVCSILWRHWIKKYPDLAFTRFRILSGFKHFHIWRADPKGCGFVRRIHRIRVDGSRIRKEKVADPKISGYVWTGPNSFLNLDTVLWNITPEKFPNIWQIERNGKRAMNTETVWIHVFMRPSLTRRRALTCIGCLKILSLDPGPKILILHI